MKHALVTGGTGVIGSAICRELAHRGHHVFVHTRARAELAQQIAFEIQSEGGSAEPVSFDVIDADTTETVLQSLLARAPIQILVNNAGCTADAPLAGMSRSQWRGVIDVILHGFFNVTQPLLLPMIATRWGRIVNIASVAALAGNRGQANYAAAKAGLIGATKALALEVARRGVTANAVAPGIIDTPMAQAVFDDAAIKRLVPMQRAGTPEEVARLVAFLASDDAAYISGQVLSINGAMY
ncbi:MAG: 3-oxoacyl-ACP reductase FabG [Betaproteobacteria bacterium]|nr:3-oxoacyl-ACP reductase FabG [Betaproteobacteria bacterium]MBA3775402.1 3-oxoacyl-ACP reductase FabG [Betaproteobacteria bacterium]